jgi:hypothetical protein
MIVTSRQVEAAYDTSAPGRRLAQSHGEVLA